MPLLTINIERAEQIRDILAAFDAARIVVLAIDYDDDNEKIHVVADNDSDTIDEIFTFSIGSDDDALTFVSERNGSRVIVPLS